MARLVECLKLLRCSCGSVIMIDAPTFDELIRRVRAGDPDAAAELVRNYEPAIRRAVRFRLADARLAEPARLDGHLPVGPGQLLRPRAPRGSTSWRPRSNC